MQPTGGERRFLFRGHAVPLAGRIRRPTDFVIPAQAPSSAAIVGGHSRARVDAPQLPGGIVSFASAESAVEGDFENTAEAVKFTHGNHGQNDLPTVTSTWAVVRDLKVTIKGPTSSRELKAARVEMQLQGRAARNGKEPSIRPTKAAIDGLTLDGYALTVRLRDKTFCENDTREKVSRAYEADETFFSSCGHMFFEPGGGSRRAAGQRKFPEAGGYGYCTLVDKLEWTGKPHPDAVIQGNSVYLPDFGYIYFAEMFIARDSRRLTMMRIHFGSPDGGELMVAEGDSNGQYWPP